MKLVRKSNLYSFKISNDIKKHAILRRSGMVISFKMIFEESIIGDDDLIDLSLREDIVESIEIFAKYFPIEVEVSCHLIVYIFEGGYTLSWKSKSFHSDNY